MKSATWNAAFELADLQHIETVFHLKLKKQKCIEQVYILFTSF